jgi:hypothetical protein
MQSIVKVPVQDNELKKEIEGFEHLKKKFLRVQKDKYVIIIIIIIITYHLYSRTGHLESILCLARLMPRLSFSERVFEGLYSLMLCLIISTLIYSHSDSRVPTYTGSTHFIDLLEDERLRWTFFVP